MSIQYTKPIGQHNLEENKWKYVDKTEDSVLGHHFAHIVHLKSEGKLDAIVRDTKNKKKKFPAFKPLFWDEPLHNPPIANTHICYEYDAFYKEEGKYWSRVNAGSKFANDPQRAKQYHGDHGPFKPEEFPHIMEKPQKLYGRSRVIRPFEVAHEYCKPVERSVQKPSEVFRPQRTYYPPDIWEEGLKSVCGSQIESPVFRSRTPTGRMVNTHVIDTDSIMHSKSSFSSSNRVRTPKQPYPHQQNTTHKYPVQHFPQQQQQQHYNQSSSFASLDSPSQIQQQQMQQAIYTDSSPTPLSRPQSPSIIEQHTADPLFFAQHAVVHSPNLGKSRSGHGHSSSGNNLLAIAGDSIARDGSATLNSNSFLMLDPQSSVMESVTRPQTDPGTARNKTNLSMKGSTNSSSRGVSGSGNKASRPKTQSSAIRKSHQPGFSFLGSSSDASIFDLIQYDNPVSYRRVIDALDGRNDRIIPVQKSVKSALTFTPELATSPKNKGKKHSADSSHDHSAVISEMSPLPQGVKYRPIWAQTQHFAENDSTLMLSGSNTIGTNTANNSIAGAPHSASNSIAFTDNVDRIPPLHPDPRNYVLDDNGVMQQQQLASGHSSSNNSLHSNDLSGTSRYAKTIIDKWKPPMYYSKQPVSAPVVAPKKLNFALTGERPKSRNVEDLIPVNKVRSGSAKAKSGGGFVNINGMGGAGGGGGGSSSMFIAPELGNAVMLPNVLDEDGSIFSS